MEAAAAMPVPRFQTSPAEDGHEEAAHQDVVGDGEGRDDVLGDDGDQDGHDAQPEDPHAVGLDVVLRVVGVVSVDGFAEPASHERQYVGAGNGGGGDQGAEAVDIMAATAAASTRPPMPMGSRFCATSA
jgi:hypothetical protein